MLYNKNLDNYFTVFILVCKFLLIFYGSIQFGLAYDEIFHVPDGAGLFITGQRNLTVAHPPLAAFLAGFSLSFINPIIDSYYFTKEPIVQVFADKFFWEGLHSIQHILNVARLPFYIMGVATAYYTYLLALALWGKISATVCLIFVAFCSSILAWSMFVYLDVPSTFAYVAMLYHLWLYLVTNSRTHLLFSILYMAIMLGFKFSGLSVLPFFLAVIFISFFLNDKSINSKNILKGLFGVLLSAIGCYFALWIIFGLPNNINFYQDRLKLMYGDIYPNFKFYFLQEFKTEGWWYYFPLLVVMKSSLASLTLFLVGMFYAFKNNHKNTFLEKNSVKIGFLLIPTLCFLIATSIKAIPIGSRYIIPILPIIYLVASFGFCELWKKNSTVLKLFLVCLVFSHVYGSVKIFPDNMAYFNELIGKPENGIFLTNDASIDAGHNLPRLASYLRKEKNNSPVKMLYQGVDKPEKYGIYKMVTTQSDWDGPPSPGLYAISANWLVYGQLEARNNPKHIDWLRAYKPIKVIGGSIWVYEFK